MKGQVFVDVSIWSTPSISTRSATRFNHETIEGRHSNSRKACREMLPEWSYYDGNSNSVFGFTFEKYCRFVEPCGSSFVVNNLVVKSQIAPFHDWFIRCFRWTCQIKRLKFYMHRYSHGHAFNFGRSSGLPRPVPH